MPFSRSVPMLANTALGNGNYLARFDVPDVAAATRPAQFVMVRPSGSGPLLGRPFSVARIGESGQGPTVDLLYKVIGAGTACLSRLQPGAEVHRVGPLGQPFPGPQVLDAVVLMVAGGIGIAPFPLLGAWLRRHGAGARLLYGARSAADLVGRDLMAACDVAVEVATDDGSEGHHGLVTDLLDHRLSGLDAGQKRRALVYVCGPTPMMAAADAVLARHAVAGHFSVESRMGCGIGVCLSCVVPVHTPGTGASRYRRVCVDGPTFPAGSIDWARSAGP
ncbi:MAG: dihydroorotate dehydrogenase electron transfer subunit [Acidobacteriota bacterium]